MDLAVRDRAADATRPPVVTASRATLRTVARQLWEQGVGAATVVDDQDHVVGIISERDIVARLAQGGDPDTATVETAMTRTVVSARPDDRLLDVVFLMTDAAVRHVPVIDENGEMRARLDEPPGRRGHRTADATGAGPCAKGRRSTAVAASAGSPPASS